MTKQQVNRETGNAADEAEQTMELLSGKIDAATQCSGGSETTAREPVQRQVTNATEKVGQAITTAAERNKRRKQE